MDTESIVARAQAGDRSALGELIESHQTQVYSLCLAIMRNPSDAADMTQETFVRLLRSVASFRGERATFRTWLHRLALNVCLDGLRRRRRAPASLLEAEEQLVGCDRWSEPEWSAEWRESASEVRAALAELPLSQRVALTLFYFDNSSYERIAEVIALPMNTVKSHLLRGKQNLARLLGVERARVSSRAQRGISVITLHPERSEGSTVDPSASPQDEASGRSRSRHEIPRLRLGMTLAA